MSLRKVKMLVQGYPAGLVKNNRLGVGLKPPAFYFNILTFDPHTHLAHDLCMKLVSTQRFLKDLYLRVLSCSSAIQMSPVQLLQQRMKTRGEFNAY